MLIVDGWERNVAEFSSLKPMNQCCINCHTLLCGDIRAIFKIAVLPLLLRFQIETCKSTQIFLANCFINGGSSFYSLPVVISSVSPPIRLLFHVSQDHVLDRGWHSRHFPRDVCFPTTPRFSKMLHYCLGLISLHSFRHHIHDIFHHSCS